jgi:hypothetical protein
LSRLIRIAILVWVGRWAAQELAAYAGRHWLPLGPPPKEVAGPRPGWMPPV